MDPRGAQTFEGKRKSKEIKNLVKVEREVCIIKNMMAIA